jgi:flagellar basal-body rod protein FlgG
MNYQLNRQDAIANNLANINTVGYKKDDFIGAAFQEELFLALDRRAVTPIGSVSLGVEVDQVRKLYCNGESVRSGDCWRGLFRSGNGDGSISNEEWSFYEKR